MIIYLQKIKNLSIQTGHKS